MGDLNFDATQVAPATGEFEPVPNGTYPLAVTASEKKVNGANVGWSLTMQVLGADEKGNESSKGKSFRIFLNLQHSNAQAQEIAQKEFSALCHATGVLKPQNMAEIHNVPFVGKVAVTPPREKDGKAYGPGNKIAQYLTIKGEKLGGVVGTIASAPKAAVKASAPAWAQKAS